MRPVGYYVHHHGSGHVRRYEKIRARSELDLVAISEIPIPGGVRLPSDIPPHPDDPTAGGALHWAPIDDERITRRSQIVGDWIASTRPSGVVVDVSVEVALLCRLFGVPTIVVRQHGDRFDLAHELAYRSARRLLAPFPSALEHPTTPSWVVAKTDYSGFVMADAEGRAAAARSVPGRDDVVILWGRGGGRIADDDLDALVTAVAPHRVWCAGTFDLDGGRRDSVIECGVVDDVGALLVHQPTVVASAGNNAVADAARAGSPLVVVPQERPFAEQLRHAQSLAIAEVAASVVGTTSPSTWRTALLTARRRRPTLARLAACDGACEAAQIIHAVFERPPAHERRRERRDLPGINT